MVINKINDCMFFINAMEVSKDELKKYIVDEKNKRIAMGFQFTLDDLVLIRSINEEMFPFNGCYFPLNKDNCYKKTLNPFDYFFQSIKFGYDENYLGRSVLSHESEMIDIYHPVYRDTKHFTINSLSSNISELFMPTITFNDRPIIIIEPMKEKIDNGLLVNLNPIDTFFNLHNTYMEVSKNAVFLISEDKFKDMKDNDEYKKMLGKHNIYLFKGDPSVACDVALLNLGILPQHSIGQRELVEEFYREKGFVKSDTEYLELFRCYIEYLNNEYLSSSYFHLSKDIIESRKKYEHIYPGLLHANTKFSEEETKNTMNYLIKAYADYMRYLSRFGNQEFNDKLYAMISLIEYDVKDKYPFIRLTFFDLQQQYERVLKDFLSKVKYNKFISITQEFNYKQISNINKKRMG